jgi:hypothetical protein
MGPRAFLDAVVKRKIPSPRWESNPSTPIVLVAYFKLLSEDMAGRDDFVSVALPLFAAVMCYVTSNLRT